MKLLIHGRNLEITPALRDYTQTKLERATSHFADAVREADVHLSVARNPRVPQQTAEVTVFANGTVIRAQERSENLYASIDLAAGKLARCRRQEKKYTNGCVFTCSIDSRPRYSNLTDEIWTKVMKTENFGEIDQFV